MGTRKPLTIEDPLVKFEFVRMPDSMGFGDYTESGQTVPISFEGKAGSYGLQLFLNDGPPIYGGRELWGFPKKFAQPSLQVVKDHLVGALEYGPTRVATATMGFKHRAAEEAAVLEQLRAPRYLLKIIPRADGCGPRICELVRFHFEDIELKEAWEGPAALDLRAHALAPVADLPVLEDYSCPPPKVRRNAVWPLQKRCVACWRKRKHWLRAHSKHRR